MSEFDYNTSGEKDIYFEIKKYLFEDEEVLWTGKPCTSAKPKTQPFLILFALFWLGFAIFWTIGASIGGGLFGFFGLPFICVGIGLVYGITVGPRRQLQNTVYAVTDKRCIILTRKRRGDAFFEFRFDSMSNIRLNDVKGNVGTIVLRNTVEYDEYDYMGGLGRRRRVNVSDSSGISSSFILIDNVQTVYRMISERINLA